MVGSALVPGSTVMKERCHQGRRVHRLKSASAPPSSAVCLSRHDPSASTVSTVNLLLDRDYDVTTFTCDCGTVHDRVTGFVNHETDGALALFYADCVHHDGQH